MAVCILSTSAPDALASDSNEARPLVIPTIPLPGGGKGLHAAVAGHPGLFLFDACGGVTFLTPATCRPWGQVTGLRATGEPMGMPSCDDARLTIGSESFLAPTASMLDLQRMTGPEMPALFGVIALDLFAGRVIAVRPIAHEMIVETGVSLQQRMLGAKEVPRRLVREIDTGNGGPLMLDQHVAPQLRLAAARHDLQQAPFELVEGVPVGGPARVGDLILDGDIGADMLSHWDVTFDLASGRMWFRAATNQRTAPK